MFLFFLLLIIFVGRKFFIFKMKHLSGPIIPRDRYKRSKLREIRALENLCFVFSRAFAECALLTTVDFSSCDSLKTLHDYAFYNCSSLEKVTLPAGFEYILTGCFQGCVNLRHINLQNSIKSIGDYAFHGCRNLSNIIIPSNINHLGVACFKGCGIENVAIPHTVDIIKYGAFMDCTKIKYVDIQRGDNILIVEENAFANSSVEVIDVRRSLVTFRKGCFGNCTKLRTLICECKRTFLSSAVFNDSLLKLAVFAGEVHVSENPFFGCNHLLGIWIGTSSLSTENYLRKLKGNQPQMIVVGTKLIHAPLMLLKRLRNKAILPRIMKPDIRMCYHHFRWLPYVRYRKMLRENEYDYISTLSLSFIRLSVPQEIEFLIMSFLHWSDISI